MTTLDVGNSGRPHAFTKVQVTKIQHFGESMRLGTKNGVAYTETELEAMMAPQGWSYHRGFRSRLKAEMAC